MKWKGYEKYKPSGVEWLRDVPEHWEVKRLKFIGSVFIGLTYSPDDIVNEDYGEEKALVLRSTNIQKGCISFHDNVYVRTFIPERLYIKKGDILICSRNGSRHLVGKNAIVKEEMKNVTFGAFTTVVRSKINNYLFYTFNSSIFKYQATGFLTTTINQLTNSNLNSIIIPLPPLPEQKAIAAFLDKKTQTMDTLIQKKQNLINLLKEKRTALISKAVTKGLDPKVKLKPSGVEWLGDVPEHWEVKKLKWVYHYIKSGDGISPNNINSDYTYPVYGGNGIMGFSEKYNHDGENIIIGRVGANCGNVYLISGKKWISDNALNIELSNCNKKYIYYFLKARNLNQLANQNAQPLITGNIVGNQFIPLPPLHEQKAIAAFLDRETQKIDRLITKVKEAIMKLKEYRTSLISAAVTGKIDVREEK